MSRFHVFEGTGQGERDEAGAEHLETIALLQDEIARLENELLAREQASQDGAAAATAGAEALAIDPAALAEMDRLKADLAVRDETIGLLLDQLQLVEQAEAASKAEWEQLSSWVAEVEERVERQSGGSSLAQQDEIDVQRRQAEESRLLLSRERHAWAEQRRELEREIERVHGLLARAAQAEGAVGSVLGAEAAAAMEAESRRLRGLCEELATRADTEVEAARLALESAEGQATEARKQCELLQDERDRERREFEIAITSLRAQVTRASLSAGATAPPPAAAGGPGESSHALDPDMRIRAFRQHLKEIHSHEAEARRRTGLSARLSRLWGRTAPA